ncbi:MAG: regulatory protein RecX, partial [Ardenticatenales bacterium]|nr:regulatory protein RecX [Ardenticatenales bacterium]
RRSLEGKGFDDIAIDHSLERLRETDLVDDVAFAHYWIEQRQLYRPRGAAMLRYELGQKGVERDIIAAALENIDEETLAYQAARGQAARLCHLPQKDFNRRLGSYLARRGFPYSIVREIADRLRDELEVDEDE